MGGHSLVPPTHPQQGQWVKLVGRKAEAASTWRERQPVKVSMMDCFLFWPSTPALPTQNAATELSESHIDLGGDIAIMILVQTLQISPPGPSLPISILIDRLQTLLQNIIRSISTEERKIPQDCTTGRMHRSP